MQRYIQSFKEFLIEAGDDSYYQETFYFTVLISMSKERGGSRDETKNDIRALPEVLTVTLVEPEKGGVQKDLGTKYLSTLKIHVRKPRDISKDMMMKRIVKMTGRLRGVSVLRYKERKPTQRKKVFQGPGSYKITEADYQKRRRKKSRQYAKMKNRLIGKGPQKTGGDPFNLPASKKRGPSAPGPFGAMGEGLLDEAMMGPDDLPEGVVVVVLKEPDGTGFKIYYAERDKPNVSLKPGDLDRMENGPDVFGALHARLGRNEPYDGIYIVQNSKAKDKFGPLLYDVALEVAGKAGLKPMLDEVSDDASAVWKFYDEHRKEDVKSKSLVDTHEFDKVMPADRARKPEKNGHLAKAYFKKDKSVTQKLTEDDKYVELKPGTRVSTPSAREELTDLARELDIPIVKSQDLSRFDRLYEDVLITIGKEQDENDLMAFDIQPDLNQKIWDGDQEVRPGVKAALMDIVEEFLEGLDMDLDLKDVIVTGSLANYNWSKFSDIDLHILVDFAEVNDNEAMVKKFFDAVRSNWNKLHNILVKGHEVEIYMQDEHEPHVSTGVYSLLNNRWLVVPKKVRPAIDRHTATKKMKQIAREVDKLSLIYDNGQHDEAFSMAERIKEKIKRMRRAGLDRSGIYSPENLAFKMLRRSGDIEQLFSIYTQAYDKLYSMDQ